MNPDRSRARTGNSTGIKWKLNVLTGHVTRDFVAVGGISRRAMTMGYMYFVIFIAACGLVIIGYGSFVAYVNKGGNLSLFGQDKNTLPRKSVPPLKNTVSGNSDLENERNELLEKVDIWQKDHEQRRSSFNNATYSLSGTKYHFEPASRNRSAAASSS